MVCNICNEEDVGGNDDGDGLDDDCDDDGILGQVAQWGAGQSDSCL